MEELALKVEHVSKEYRLGQIGGGTLKAEIQSKIAKWRHKEDPNLKIGEKAHEKNERFLALDDVSFEIKKGEKIGIIGHNGAGKSTILKLICRVTAPTKGNIYLNGRITSMLEVGTGFHGELTGRENIYLNGSILGMSKAEIDEKIDEIIEFSEVKQFIDTPVKRYSSGMHVKLGFAVASHLNSEIMIMDEVLAVGDVAFQNKCIDQMKKVADEEGRTILYVSHNMNTIRQLCDRCIVLDHGMVAFIGDVDEAINVYLGKGVEEAQGVHYTKEDHETWCSQKLYLQSSILQNDISTLFCGDVLTFDINYHSLYDLDHVCARLVLVNEKREPIGMAISEDDMSFKMGEEGNISISFNTDKLSSGKYKFRISFFHINEFGMHEYICIINEFFACSINDKPELHHNMQWNNSSWGYYSFPDLIVRK